MQLPPETVTPAESTLQEGTVDTLFVKNFAGDDSLQVFLRFDIILSLVLSLRCRSRRCLVCF